MISVMTTIENDKWHTSAVSLWCNELTNAEFAWLALQKEATSTRDLSKPFGEACNADNTLKDASEREWVHLPSQSVAAGSTKKRAYDGGNESSSEDDADELPKAKQKVNANTLQIGAIFCGGVAWPF